MKTCFKCLVSQPLSGFYKHPSMADGHLNKCKSCTKADAKKHRTDNLEKVQAYDRMRSSEPHRVAARKSYAKTEAARISAAASKRRYAESHPDKTQARNMLSTATRDGKVIKQPCFCCGGKAEAHHPDYSRPLDVVWLCDTHHKEAHKLGREINRQQRSNHVL